MVEKRKVKWWNPRTWPHPQYGSYGGAQTRCENDAAGVCPLAQDDLDACFELHDVETKEGDPLNDVKLVGRMLTVNPFGRYERPLYGRAYHVGALVVFTLMAPFTTPVRAIKKLFERDGNG